MDISTSKGTCTGRPTRIALAVVFADPGDDEQQAIDATWRAAASVARHWTPSFYACGLAPLPDDCPADLLVYLGESSRFQGVAGALSQRIPVVFVKSTIEELLDRPPGGARRYRMSTGVRGIAAALAAAAPVAPSVDWRSVPWPPALAAACHLDPAEQAYVDASIAAFREAAAARGIRWRNEVPPDGSPFSVFVTMHDPLAARLADAALTMWPQCSVLAADGMVSICRPCGRSWPDRLVRVRHWFPQSRAVGTRRFRETFGRVLPDFDSAGMLFGTLGFLDGAQGSAPPDRLEEAGRHPGPLGAMRMTASGRPAPERLVLFRGDRPMVVTVGQG